MSLFVFLLINLNLVIAYALYVVFLQHASWLRINRTYLMLMPVVAIVIPMAPISQAMPGEIMWVQMLQEVKIFGVQSAKIHPSIIVADYIYMAVLFIALLLLVFRLLRLNKSMTGDVLEKYKGVKVYLKRGNQSASFSFFGKIFISERDLENKEPILLHEYAHVVQKHSLDVLLMKIWTALFWFNPIIYYWEKLMKENHEFLADQYVVERDYPIKKYSMSIVSATFNVSVPTLSNSFNAKSTVQKRIERLQRKPKIQNNMKYLLIAPALAGMLYLASCAKTELDTNEFVHEKIAEQLVDKPDVKAEFNGGMDGLINYMVQEMKYPKDLEKEGVEGKVLVEFTVSNEGVVENAAILESAGHDEFDNEAMRVINQMPAWAPAQKDDKPVNTKMILPINFKLQ